jgi:Mn2+/Fe2+ NRAMP family transporter
MEAFIIGLIAIIGLSFLVEILIARPDLGEVAQGIDSAHSQQYGIIHCHWYHWRYRNAS